MRGEAAVFIVKLVFLHKIIVGTYFIVCDGRMDMSEIRQSLLCRRNGKLAHQHSRRHVRLPSTQDPLNHIRRGTSAPWFTLSRISRGTALRSSISILNERRENFSEKI